MASRRLAVVTLVLAGLLLPMPAAGQGIATSFQELRLLVRAGDGVTVTDAGGRTASGKITALSPAALTLLVDGRPREWREEEVASISQRHVDSLGNGALIGLGVGAGLATVVLIGVSTDADFDLSGGDAAAILGIYAGLGAGIGTGIDAMITRHRVIFDRRAVGPSFSVTPLVGPAGARVVVTFGF